MADPSELQFDHAVYEKPAGTEGPACGMCGKPVGAAYFQWLGRVACPSCRGSVVALDAHARSGATFARAAGQGAVTALACGVAYAVFVGVTRYQLALVTIGIAYAIAYVIRRATQGVSGRRYQVLALALTYAASAMGYAPQIWHDLTDVPSAAHGQAHKGETGDETPSMAGKEGDETPPMAGKEGDEIPPPKHGGGEYVRAVAVLGALVLAAPFLAATQAPIGLLIIGFALWEAWRRTRPLSMIITGPYEVPQAPLAPLDPPMPDAT